jgi:hypothetical protein
MPVVRVVNVVSVVRVVAVVAMVVVVARWAGSLPERASNSVLIR